MHIVRVNPLIDESIEQTDEHLNVSLHANANSDNSLKAHLDAFSYRLFMKYHKIEHQNQDLQIIAYKNRITLINRRLLKNKIVIDKKFSYFCLHYIGYIIIKTYSESGLIQNNKNKWDYNIVGWMHFIRIYRLITWICPAENDVELILQLTNRCHKLNMKYLYNQKFIRMIFYLAYHRMQLFGGKIDIEKIHKDLNYSHLTQIIFKIKTHVWMIFDSVVSQMYHKYITRDKN